MRVGWHIRYPVPRLHNTQGRGYHVAGTFHEDLFLLFSRNSMALFAKIILRIFKAPIQSNTNTLSDNPHGMDNDDHC